MKRVLKWFVPIDDQPHEIGLGPVTGVEMATRPIDPYSTNPIRSGVYVWTEEPYFVDAPIDTWEYLRMTQRKRAQVVGTGQPFDSNGTVVGTVRDGDFVWHLVRYS